MSDLSTDRPSFLADLENRQEEVLRRLDDLNRRIESAVSQGRIPVDAEYSSRPLGRNGLSRPGDL